MVESFSSAGSRRQHAVRKAFRENLPATQNGIAPEAPYEDLEIYAAPTERQVSYSTQITTLNTAGQSAANRTCATGCTRSNTDANAIGRYGGALHHEADRYKTGRSKSLIHCADSLQKQHQRTSYLQQN